MKTQTATEKKERPIIFSAESVKAILGGRKTQTRRVIKPQPIVVNPKAKPNVIDWIIKGKWQGAWEIGDGGNMTCPYGKVGDLLWVKEKFEIIDASANYGELVNMSTYYPADNTQYESKCWLHEDKAAKYSGVNFRGKPYSSMFMPRWASRLTLEITNIRVERLQAITEKDICEEGFNSFLPRTALYNKFTAEWDKINGAGSWDKNPFVWVIEFKKISPE